VLAEELEAPGGMEDGGRGPSDREEADVTVVEVAAVDVDDLCKSTYITIKQRRLHYWSWYRNLG